MFKNKSIYLVFLFFLIFIILFLLKRNLFYSKASQSLSPIAISPTKEISFSPLSLEEIFSFRKKDLSAIKKEEIISLIITGDVILGRSVNYITSTKNNFSWPFEKTKFWLKNADITFINLETPLIDNCSLTVEGMIFCADKRNITGLIDAGVDIVNLANNHLGDYLEDGVKQTTKLLDENNIKYCGFSQPTLINIKGKTIAFLGYNEIPSRFGKKLEEEKIIEELKTAREKADFVIVAFHWGTEYTHQPTERQKYFAHLAIDNGADLIVGNHPHWIQPVEIYKEKIIFYALGNFIFDQMWSEKTKQGIVAKIYLYQNKVVNVEILPIKIVNYGQPFFIEGNQKTKILEELREISFKN